VGSRFDDWIYWTSPLQLQLFTTVHTLNSFLITNLSLHFFRFSRILLFNANHGFSAITARKRLLLPPPPVNLRHEPRIENTACIVDTPLLGFFRVHWYSRCCLATLPYCCHAIIGEGVYRPLHRNGGSSIVACVRNAFT
jgi:hypothetical protein